MTNAIAITGGTKGIGRAIINIFADKGFDIITCSRSNADLEGLKAEIKVKDPNVHFEGIEADLSDKKA
jgi:short-subunit dehydrogenase